MHMLAGVLILLSLWSNPSLAQCSHPDCQGPGRYWKPALEMESMSRLGSRAFHPPQPGKWRWQPSLRVQTVTAEHPFWLTDDSSGERLPKLSFVAPRLDIRTRILIYQSRGEEGNVDRVSLGLHRRPQGFGVVWQRTF